MRGEVFENRRLAWIDTMAGEKTFVGLRHRFRLEFAGDDIEDVLEMLVHFQPAHHGFGMRARPVGEDEFAGQFSKRRPERRIGFDRRVIGLVHEVEKIIRLHAVLDHQPAQGRAVAPVIIFLQAESLFVRHVEEFHDVVANPHIDLLPQVKVMGVEGVVEVEHPGLDPGKPASCVGRRN